MKNLENSLGSLMKIIGGIGVVVGCLYLTNMDNSKINMKIE